MNEQEIRFIISKNIDKDGIMNYINLEPETISFMSNLKKVYNPDLRRVIKKIFKKEKNPLEKIFYGALLERVVGSKFIYRLYFYLLYPDLFSESILKYKKFNNPVESVLNILFLFHHKNKEKMADKFIEKVNTKELELIIPFCAPIISKSLYKKIINNLNDELFVKCASKLDKLSFHEMLAIKISKVPVKDAIILVNSVESLDNILLLKLLIEIFSEKFNKSASAFEKFNELRNILWIDEECKTEIDCAWLRIFIKFLAYNQFIVEFKKIRRDTEEMKIYKLFYDSIVIYKKEGILDFRKFASSCEDFKDTNRFSSINLAALAEPYREST